MPNFKQPEERLDTIFYPSNYDEFVELEEFFSITGINSSTQYVGIQDGEGVTVFTEIQQERTLGDGYPDLEYVERTLLGYAVIERLKTRYVEIPRYHYENSEDIEGQSWLATEICPRGGDIDEKKSRAIKELFAVSALIGDKDLKMPNIAVHPEEDKICYFDVDRSGTSVLPLKSSLEGMDTEISQRRVKMEAEYVSNRGLDTLNRALRGMDVEPKQSYVSYVRQSFKEANR